MRRRGPLCDKGQLEVIDDPVHHGIVGEEGDDFHHATALRAEERVNFVHLSDHLSPAAAGDSWAFFLDDEKLMSRLPLL